MEHSIFMDKSIIPTNEDLIHSLGEHYKLWQAIKATVLKLYPAATGEWNFPGKKYGWSFRMKDKKRAILYFLPRDHSFKVAFVFGNKATEQVVNSNVSETIKTELMAARVYAEGRGIRMNVENENSIRDIRKLIEIKLAN